MRLSALSRRKSGPQPPRWWLSTSATSLALFCLVHAGILVLLAGGPLHAGAIDLDDNHHPGGDETGRRDTSLASKFFSELRRREQRLAQCGECMAAELAKEISRAAEQHPPSSPVSIEVTETLVNAADANFGKLWACRTTSPEDAPGQRPKMRFVMAVVLAHTCTNMLRHAAGLPPGTAAAASDARTPPNRALPGVDTVAPGLDSGEGGGEAIECLARDLNTQRWRATYDKARAFVIEHDLPDASDGGTPEEGNGGGARYFASVDGDGMPRRRLSAERAVVERTQARPWYDAAAAAVPAVSAVRRLTNAAGRPDAAGGGAGAAAAAVGTAARQRLHTALRRVKQGVRRHASEAAAAVTAAAVTTPGSGSMAPGQAITFRSRRAGSARSGMGMLGGNHAGRFLVRVPPHR